MHPVTWRNEFCLIVYSGVTEIDLQMLKRIHLCYKEFYIDLIHLNILYCCKTRLEKIVTSSGVGLSFRPSFY